MSLKPHEPKLCIPALVIAPNILRPISMPSDLVFANTAFETAFIVNLLENLNVDTVDPEFIPDLPQPKMRVPSTLTLLDSA